MSVISLVRTHIGRSDDYTPPTLVSTAGPVAAGAGIGAAIGGSVGFGLGLAELRGDRVEIETVTHQVTRPVLVGADYDDVDRSWRPGSNGQPGHWVRHDDDWDPIIERQNTGQTYTEKRFTHSMAYGPVAGALVGMGVGAVVGGLAGALVQHLKPSVAESKEVPANVAWLAEKAPWVGAGLGALAGATAGLAMGQVSQAHAQSLTQTIYAPITERQQLGWIPFESDNIPRPYSSSGDYQLRYDQLPKSIFGEVPFQGKEAVFGEVPTGQLSERVETVRSHNFTPLTGALLGAGLGAAGGFGLGVATGVIARAIAS